MTVLSDFPYLDPVIELDARPGYLALVWVTEPPRGAWRIWQIFTGQIQNVVYRATQEYAAAVVYGRGEDGP